MPEKFNEGAAADFCCCECAKEINKKNTKHASNNQINKYKSYHIKLLFFFFVGSGLSSCVHLS
jgi:hypothetical protein